MELYYSPNSPYARIARVAAIEAGLQDRVRHVEVENRSPDSPLLRHSPVCRVPTLVDGDLVLGEARNICGYFDQKTGVRRFLPADGDWSARSRESMVMGFLEGVAFWVRELRRGESSRSDFLLGVEQSRAARCLTTFEEAMDSDALGGAWDFTQIALACALGIMDHSLGGFAWRDGRPRLSAWAADCAARPAMGATAPIQA